MTNKRNKKQCMECKKSSTELRIHKNKLLCYKCFIKNKKIIGIGNFTTLEKALKKIYKIREYKYKGTIKASCSFPSILSGRKITIKLEE